MLGVRCSALGPPRFDARAAALPFSDPFRAGIYPPPGANQSRRPGTGPRRMLPRRDPPARRPDGQRLCSRELLVPTRHDAVPKAANMSREQSARKARPGGRAPKSDARQRGASGRVRVYTCRAPRYFTLLPESQARGERMVEVVLNENDRLDWALKKFRRKMLRSGRFKDMKKKRYYEKPSEARKRKAAAARRRNARARRRRTR
jgi:small subunit ribosomal protein S21